MGRKQVARSFLRQWTKDALPGDPSEMPDVRYGQLPLPEFPTPLPGFVNSGWSFPELSENETERRGKLVGWEDGGWDEGNVGVAGVGGVGEVVWTDVAGSVPNLF